MLLGLLHSMPLRPGLGAALGGARGAAFSGTRTGYGVLLGMLHSMSLRPRYGAAFGGARSTAFSSTRTGYGVLLGMLHRMPAPPSMGGFWRRGGPRVSKHAYRVRRF